MEAILGRKLGMTQVFSANGEARGVTVVEAGPCVVLQIKTQANDGYEAIQIGFGTRKHINKPMAGHMKRQGQFRFLREIRVDDTNGYEIGQKLGPEMFEEGDIVDVVGKSKGKGFAGVMKRHNFKGLSASHGTQRKHRSPGSIGGCATPGRVFKGMRMAGRMGGVTTTTLSLKVHAVDAEKGLVLIKGAVPGPRGGLLLVRSAVKGGPVGSDAK